MHNTPTLFIPIVDSLMAMEMSVKLQAH